MKEDTFKLLRLLSNNDELSQRDISRHLDISLGKTNYLLKALAKKGLIKIKNFATREKKLKKIQYMLTKTGLEEKAKLTYYFLKKKEKEYLEFKKEAEYMSLHRTENPVSM
jgi:EPS-associated MarR family transcriptional regulator